MTEIKACPFCGASEPCYKHEPVEVRGHADDLKARLQAGEVGAAVDLLFHRWLTRNQSFDLCTVDKPYDKGWEEYDAWCSDDGIEVMPIRYTTSIDAAYGVIPEGWGIEITADDVDATVNLWCARDGELVVTELWEVPTLPAAILLAVIDARENQ